MGKIVYNGREYLSAGTASTMQGATSTTDGVSGLVPQPLIADREKFLKGDGTWGTAGTEVEANPSGTATDTLQKVDIDGVIYDIQGGGGGGSNLIVDAQIYSFEEKQVGVWTDGKPLYQRTWEFSSSVILNSNGWFTTSIPNTNMDKIINVEAMSETGTRWAVSGACDEGSYVNLICFRNSTITVKYVTVRYTKTTDAAGSGGYQAYGFSPIIYSTEEREVGVWIDNKPLYQKTYLFNALTNVPSGRWFDTGFTATDISIVGEAYGFYQDTTAGVAVPILASCDSGTNQPLYIHLARSASTEMHGFTIQYTKTTDVAGSGSYNTLGVPNVHYTTDEQVIGTWFGKPLYQKTFVFENAITLSNANTWYSTPIVSANYNMSKIIDAVAYSPTLEDVYKGITAEINSGQYLIVLNYRYSLIQTLTIQYTKTTD